MNKSLSCLMGLLIIVLIISLPIVCAQENRSIAQENSSILSKNLTQKNVVLNNSLNLSITNKTVLNFTTNPAKLSSLNSAAFVISSDTKGSSLKNANVNATSSNSKIQPLSKSAFVINGYAMPALNEFQNNQSLLNAAYLSRRVEGTPHGYVTYYN